MPFKMGFRIFIQRFINDVAERRLTDSYLLRRAAQLTLYYWTRASENAGTAGSRLGQWLTGQGGGVAVRVVGRFVRNLQEEVKRLRGPGHR